MSRRTLPHPTRWRWLSVLPAVLFAMGLRGLMEPGFEGSMPFVLAYPMVAAMAVFAGAGPAMLTAVGCAGWAASSHLPAPTLTGPGQPLQIGAFLLGSFTVVVLLTQFRSQPQAEAPPTGPTPPVGPSGLQRWLRAALFASVLVPATLLATAVWWTYRSAYEDGQASVDRASRLAMEHAQQAFIEARAVAAHADRLLGADPAAGTAAMSLLEPLMTGTGHVASIVVWDADGRVQASSEPGQAPAAEGPLRALFQAHALGAVGPALTAGGELDPAHADEVFATYRRSTPAGDFAGVVGIGMSTAYFTAFYQSFERETPGLSTAALSDANGVVFLRQPAQPRLPRVPSTSAWLQRVQAGHAAGIVAMSTSFDGRRRLLGFPKVGELPLYVTVGLAEDVVLAQWRQTVGLLAALTALAIVGLTLFSVVALKLARREDRAQAALRAENDLRLQAERSLLQTQKLEALGQLTGGVAHDFNNLLGVVSNNVHLLRALHPEIGRSAPVASIDRAVGTGARLTRQLLAFSRRQPAHPETLQLGHWLPGTLELVRTSLGSSIRLELDVAPDLPPVSADAAQLELALINLGVNAKDAMTGAGRGRHLRIAARRLEGPPPAPLPPGDYLEISVHDDGPGMTPEVLRRAFEPFYTTKEPGRGTGLGLSQVYGMATQAGGTARITSRPGDGTTVGIVLPVAPAPAARSPAEAPDQRQPLHGSVLLVEDNAELAATTLAVMRSFGVDVTHAADARQATALLAQPGPRFDAVVSDIQMPGGMDGFALADHIRERHPKLPVILMTGYAEQMARAPGAGVPVLSKPAPPSQLYRALASALEA